MTTIRQALQHAITQLSHLPTPRLDAQVLLSHLLNVEKTYLIAYDDRILTDDEQSQFDSLIQRRSTGEPIAYIIGYKHFWDLDFIVNEHVLIPRPETEHLIEEALNYLDDKPDVISADIGTGSGAIAVTVAKHSKTTMHAVDTSPDALKIARDNAQRHQTDLTFHHGSLAQPLIERQIKVNLLMANLPYIATDDLAELEVTKHEPTLALDGGDDGLDLVSELLRQVPQVCHPDALILLEIGMEQGQAVIDFANQHLTPKSATVIKDLAGLDRIIKIEL